MRPTPLRAVAFGALLTAVVMACNAPAKDSVVPVGSAGKAPVTSQSLSNRTPSPRPTGSILYLHEASHGAEGGPPAPAEERDQLMALDLETMKSSAVGEPGTYRPVARAGSVAYVAHNLDTTERLLAVTHRAGKWRIDPTGSTRPAAFKVAVAKDASRFAEVCGDDICFADDHGQITKQRLSAALVSRMQAGLWVETIVWTSKHRLLLAVAARKKGEPNDGPFLAKLEVWLVEPDAGTDTRLDIAAVGQVDSTEDGTLAWGERAGDKLVLAVGQIDDLRGARRTTAASVTRDTQLTCLIADSTRAVCLLMDTSVRPGRTLVLLSPGASTVRDIQADMRFDVPDDIARVLLSPDRRWVTYERLGVDSSTGFERVVAPIDVANGPVARVLGDADRAFAWLP